MTQTISYPLSAPAAAPPLASSTDCRLAGINGAMLAVSLFALSRPIDPTAISLGCIAGSLLVNRMIKQRLMQSSGILHTSWEIARRSISQIVECGKNLGSRPWQALSALPIHLINAAGEALPIAAAAFGLQAYFRPVHMVNLPEPLNESCSPVPEGWEKLPLEERIVLLHRACSHGMELPNNLNEATPFIVAGNQPFDFERYRSEGCKYIRDLYLQTRKELCSDESSMCRTARSIFEEAFHMENCHVKMRNTLSGYQYTTEANALRYLKP